MAFYTVALDHFVDEHTLKIPQEWYICVSQIQADTGLSIFSFGIFRILSITYVSLAWRGSTWDWATMTELKVVKICNHEVKRMLAMTLGNVALSFV